jgi:Tfp pilus assembly protein PilW
MIALSLSVVLIGGIVTIYTSSKRTYQTRDQLSLMDENARVALVTLTRSLEHANYKIWSGDYFIRPDAITANRLTNALCSDGQRNIKAINQLKTTQDGSGSQSDSVGIIFAADDNLYLDCLNMGDNEHAKACRTNASGTSQYVYNSFYVAESETDHKPNLFCVSSRASNAIPITQGVENIQFLYGVDNDSDANRTVDQYLTAAEVETKKLWQKVFTIKVAILMRSNDPALEQAQSKVYKLLNTTINTNDRYQRAVYSTVVQLRNAVDN